MCIGIPMQVMQTDPKANTAKVVGRGEHKRINTALVGHVNIGDWLLIFMNDAREILSPQRAQEIDATLNMVEAAMQGQVEVSTQSAAFALPSLMDAAQLALLTGAIADTKPNTPSA